MRRGQFSLGFFQDMGDISDDEAAAGAGIALENAARMEQAGADAAFNAGANPAPLEVAALANRDAGQLLTPDATYASASPSGSTTTPDSTGAFDFFKSAFGSLAAVGAAVAPPLLAQSKKFAPIFGTQPAQPAPRPAPSSGPSTTTVLLVVGAAGAAYFVFGKKGSSGSSTKTNPKRKGKKKGAKRHKSKNSKKHKSHAKKRSGKKRSGKRSSKKHGKRKR